MLLYCAPRLDDLSSWPLRTGEELIPRKCLLPSLPKSGPRPSRGVPLAVVKETWDPGLASTLKYGTWVAELVRSTCHRVESWVRVECKEKDPKGRGQHGRALQSREDAGSRACTIRMRTWVLPHRLNF
jgi:hypothetical protein